MTEAENIELSNLTQQCHNNSYNPLDYDICNSWNTEDTEAPSKSVTPIICPNSKKMIFKFATITLLAIGAYYLFRSRK